MHVCIGLKLLSTSWDYTEAYCRTAFFNGSVIFREAENSMLDCFTGLGVVIPPNLTGKVRSFLSLLLCGGLQVIARNNLVL